MRGEKAQAAVDGIKEMILECQGQTTSVGGISIHKITLLQFGDSTSVMCGCDDKWAGDIDSDTISLAANEGSTNITSALEEAYRRLVPFCEMANNRKDKSKHPIPLVILFSDGKHNAAGTRPKEIADKIKSLNVDGQPVAIAAMGIHHGSDNPDVSGLSEIASTDLYATVSDLNKLTAQISKLGSYTGNQELADIMKE